MKRILIVLLVLICLVLTASCDSAEQEITSTFSVDYSSGVYFDKAWDSTIGTFSGDAIPDEECALAVATAIHNTLDDNEKQYRVPFSVFYDEEDEIWIVSFGLPPATNGVFRLGGDCNIALQKSDGKVLRIWFGE